uniref:Retrotransposon Copia-like N-terminal domain-containing protein n=1 Tax=Lactuca sativa TaxID=4236 RepID=A0A9R1WIC2_LACSA|nr:hypothetical protein LSAT_V11C100034920 [Lactuca sativa]
MPANTMPTLTTFTTSKKTTNNSYKYAFTLSPNNYGYWKTMLQPFLVTNNLFGYVDGTIHCPPATIIVSTTSTSTGKEGDTVTTSTSTTNPCYNTLVYKDARVRCPPSLRQSFQHVQSNTSGDLWLSLEGAYAPHTSSHEFLKPNF